MEGSARCGAAPSAYRTRRPSLCSTWHRCLAVAGCNMCGSASWCGAPWWSARDGLAFDVCADLWRSENWERNEARRIPKRADMAGKGFTAPLGQIHCQGGVAVARQALAECEQKLNAAQAWEGFPKCSSALWIILDMFALRLQWKRSCFGILFRNPRASG